MTWSTTPARGMGATYHWLHGLSQPNLLHCTQGEARKLAAADEMLAALQDVRRALDMANFTGELAILDAAIAKALGEPHAPTHRT